MKLDRKKDTLKLMKTDDITASNAEEIRNSILAELDDGLKFIELDLKDV